MSIQRRIVLCSLGAVLASGIGGCLSRWDEGEGRLRATSNRREQTLDIKITDSEDKQLFTETVNVTEDEWIERDGVVTGRDDDLFSVEVTKDDEIVSTTWQLSCVSDDDKVDCLSVIVTGRGDIHITQACYVF